jgi:hypothetical protein
MGTNDTRNITVRIPQIPPSFATSLYAAGDCAAGAVVGTDARPFTVGTPVIPPDPDIDVNQTGFLVIDTGTGNPDQSANGRLEGNTIN